MHYQVFVSYDRWLHETEIILFSILIQPLSKTNLGTNFNLNFGSINTFSSPIIEKRLVGVHYTCIIQARRTSFGYNPCKG